MAAMDEITDVEMTPSPPTVDTKEVVTKWLQKYKEGVLSSSHFREYWRIWVPRIYSPNINESCLNWSFNEEEAQRILFNPLEEFICNGSPSTILYTISQLEPPPTVCGRVFKMGEPTYSCRECGMDSTCVLCVDCFKKSEHRFHKYKMRTSGGGGGCCDCGDKEAWKKAPYCDIHKPVRSEEDETKRTLPEDMTERTRIVFDAVLWYAYNLLTLEHTSDLRLRDVDDDLFNIDTYCTLMYNDEVHTFEQVITTLTRIIKCNQRNAIEYATNVDREGRAVVKCSTFQHCNTFKSDIEKYTGRLGNRPLKILVMHAHVVAHQMFATKLLGWMQEFLGHGEGFRSIFAQVVLKPQPPDPCIIKGVLLRDSQLWKNARTHWHRLLISGMLLEYENKKELGKLFTKNYGNIIKDFIKDDHDHSYSICSLSVQLFTVPTLAHHLIANDDVLFILLNAFLSECSRKCNKEGRLEFERVSSQAFKRAQYMLYDLRYLLSAVPENWSDDLRKSFLQGLSIVLNLFKMMQGMDSVSRQTGQHMEYEPEWETAFNLHIRLAYSISLAVKWCSTDKVVLVKAYRATLKKLFENPCYDPEEPGEVKELADHSVALMVYDVSSKPVSIHLPLTRFLAGLHLSLQNFGLTFDSSEFQIPKPTPVQLIEPVLRCQVMIAQVHAGMWRRNGYALLNQLFFYHNVKCRTEMLDRDVQMLQIGASLIESNEFLMHMLNKFNLINWANPNFEINSLKNPEEDSIRQIITIVEEFLHLLIAIVGERYIPNIGQVTTEDRVKKEIIQQLCIKPLPHSELNKCIPDDITHETGLDEVIEELATFIKPHGNGKGVYELKKQYYDEYNVFFYHYTREELSKSEEAQRERRKTAGELDCCPPPKLPKLHEAFSMLVNLLQCDVMLHIMKTILERCLNLKARSFSEPQLHKILHLIGYALQEEQSGYYPFLLFCDKAGKWRIPEMLEDLVNSPRIEAHKDLLRWTILKFKEVSKKGLDKSEPTSTTSLSDVVSRANMTEIDDEKQRRAKLAAQRRAKLMAQMQAMQNSFMKENAKLFEETNTELSKSSGNLRNSAMDITEKIEEQAIALGPNQTTRFNIERTYRCILCQEEQKLDLEGPVLVMVAFVQQATVLCVHRSESALDISNHDPLFLNANLGPAPHTSTCGHVMHATCWQKYFNNVMLKEHKRPYRVRHPASFDVDKQEFLCPLCERLSNTILPLVPPLCSIQPSHPRNYISIEDFVNCMLTTLQKVEKVGENKTKCSENCTNIHCNACENGSSTETDSSPSECESNCIALTCPYEPTIEDLGDIAEQFKALFPTTCPKLTEKLVEMLHSFIQMAYMIGLNVNPHPTDKRLVPMTWKSFSYTVHTIEILLRDASKPLLGHLSSRHGNCLENFVRILGVLGSSWPKCNVITSHAIRLLSIILNHSNEDPSILYWDSFGILVPLTFSLPALFSKNQPTPVPTGGSLELYSLHLVFAAHIVKILATMNLEECNTTMDTDRDDDVKKVVDCEETHSIEMDTDNDNDFKEIIDLLKLLNRDSKGLTGQAIWEQVKEACRPFLRCCVLFYHYLTNVATRSTLTEIGGDSFSNMCSYLALPESPQGLLRSVVIQNLIKKWCLHPELISYVMHGEAMEIVKEPPPINQLISLPTDYSELVNTVSSFTCPNSDHEDSRNPTMCLVCGEILCSQSYCCQMELNKTVVGACNYHAHKCGAGVGIFLRVRECEILFLASPMKGCFVSPPYLDEYGETDQGLKRGHPLRLCPERYKKLHTQWLSHSIHEEIARAIDSSHTVTQWQHL